MLARRPRGCDSKPWVTWLDYWSITWTPSDSEPGAGSIESIGRVNPWRNISTSSSRGKFVFSSSVCFILIPLRAPERYIYQGIHKKFTCVSLPCRDVNSQIRNLWFPVLRNCSIWELYEGKDGKRAKPWSRGRFPVPDVPCFALAVSPGDYQQPVKSVCQLECDTGMKQN